MKIYIRDIPEEGLPIKIDYEHALIDQRYEDELTFIAPVACEGRAFNAQDEIIVTLEAVGRFNAICSRCLKKVEQDYRKTLELYFDIDPKTDSIEIGDELRQEILLNLPAKILCSKDCKGICPQCGANMNEEKCSCK